MPFDPTDISSVAFGLRSGQGLYQNEAGTTPASSVGDIIRHWHDQIGGHHFTRTDAATPAATRQVHALSGRVCCRLVDDFLDGGNLSAVFPSAASLWIALTINADDFYVAFTTADGNDSIWRYIDGTGYLGEFRTARISNYPAAMPSSGSHVMGLISGPSNYEFFLDGVSKGAQTPSYSAGDNYKLGARPGIGRDFSGDVVEVWGFSAVISSTDRANMQTYMNGLITAAAGSNYVQFERGIRGLNRGLALGAY